MKKLLVILSILSGLSAFSQCEKPEQTATGKYVSAGISVSQGDASTAGQFNTNSFFWGEFGVTRGNVSMGLNFGRSNFRFDEENDEFANFYLEPKVSATVVEKGFAKGYVLFGCGAYVARDNTPYFIEYGAGTTFSFSATDLSVQWSNWDRWNYLSLGVTRNF